MPPPRQLTFTAKLERISDETLYFAFTVPAKISAALGTRGPVPVAVLLNDAVPFMVSLAPIGGGRHWLRLNAKARLAAKIAEGDRVKVQITIQTPGTQLPIPADLEAALRTAGILEDFKAITIGYRKLLLRGIENAAKPETREKRILQAVEETQARQKKRAAQAG